MNRFLQGIAAILNLSGHHQGSHETGNIGFFFCVARNDDIHHSKKTAAVAKPLKNN